MVAVFDVLHGSAAQVGYLTAAIGVGGLLGALGAMTLGARRLALPFGLALVFWGLPITLIAPRPYFAAAAVLLAIVGAANSVEDVALFTLLQRSVPDDTLTRVLGIFWGLAMGGVAIGSIAAPVIVKAVGSSWPSSTATFTTVPCIGAVTASPEAAPPPSRRACGAWASCARHPGAVRRAPGTADGELAGQRHLDAAATDLDHNLLPRCVILLDRLTAGVGLDGVVPVVLDPLRVDVELLAVHRRMRGFRRCGGGTG